MRPLNRRMFLCVSAVGAMSAPALALQTVEAPEQVDALWREGCEAMNVHDRVLAELRREVQDPALRARAEEFLAAMRCPTCGCSLRTEDQR